MYGDNDIVDSILYGSATYTTLGMVPHQIDPKLDDILSSFKYADTQQDNELMICQQ